MIVDPVSGFKLTTVAVSLVKKNVIKKKEKKEDAFSSAFKTHSFS